MSGRRFSWQCRRRDCQAELGIVDDGVMYPRPPLPVRVERDGTVYVTCTAMLDSGRLCNTERPWSPKVCRNARLLTWAWLIRWRSMRAA